MNGVSALNLNQVSHSYGKVQAVVDADLSVDAGEVVCLVGPSGCGKSTILRLAAGLETVQKGAISLRGQVVADETGRHVPPEERHVGLVFQDFALFPHLTVASNVGFGLMSMATGERSQRITETLEQVGLTELAEVYPHAISGGQQQRVALARALAPKPSLMLMDEPFSGLDARLRDQVRDETLRVLRQLGTATLLVTHDPEEALFMADRIYLMRKGRIVQVGTPQEVYHQPTSLFVARFFSSVNVITGQVSDGRVLTALGSFAPLRPSGENEITIAFRPESLVLATVEGSGSGLRAHAIVEDSHFLGADWRIRIRVDLEGGESVRWVARGTGRPPENGETVPVFVSTDDLFLFGESG